MKGVSKKQMFITLFKAHFDLFRQNVKLTKGFYVF